MTISKRMGSHLWPTVTLGSGVATFQVGTMSPTAFKKWLATPFKTWPLNGMPRGITTSNALMRSETTATIRSSPMVYMSRTLPW